MRDISPDKRQSRRAQPPLAQRVAAAQGDLLRCRSIAMDPHQLLATPRISPRGARNAARGTFDTGS